MRKQDDIVNDVDDPRPSAIMETIHRLMHGFRSLQYRDQEVAGGTLTHMEGKVLGFFARHPGAGQRDLVAHSGRDKAQVARLVGQLRERGLLEAQADPGDRRSVCLHLSPPGQALHAALQRRLAVLAQQAVTGLSTAEQAQLQGLLDRVGQNLQDRAR